MHTRAKFESEVGGGQDGREERQGGDNSGCEAGRYRGSIRVAVGVEELYTDGEVAAGGGAVHEFGVYIEVIYIVRGHAIPAQATELFDLLS